MVFLYNLGAWDIKNHRFFRDTNWNLLANKQLKPIYVPRVLDDYDISNISYYSEENNNIDEEEVIIENDPFLDW